MQIEPITVPKEYQDFSKAYEKLKMEMLKALGIPRLVEWLARKLNEGNFWYWSNELKGWYGYSYPLTQKEILERNFDPHVLTKKEYELLKQKQSK